MQRLTQLAVSYHWVRRDAVDQSGCVPSPKPSISRRDLFRLTLGGGSGLALGGLLDVRAMRAATAEMKLSNVSEFTTSCNFCSCGCGMIAAVRDGKLLKMEGDYDHIVNRGALCRKASALKTEAKLCGWVPPLS